MNTQVDPPRMNAKRLRVASGLIFALAIAMLGPVFADVSSQSGNGYSSGHHTFTNEGSLRRGAFVDVPASKVGEPHYTFWVWTEVFNGVALDPGAQHVNQGVGGEAVAIKQTCDAKKICTSLVWRGPVKLVPAAPTDERGVFSQDPNLNSSSFIGTLRNSRGESCVVEANWLSTNTDVRMSPHAYYWSVLPLVGEVRQWRMNQMDSQVTSTCWTGSLPIRVGFIYTYLYEPFDLKSG